MTRAGVTLSMVSGTAVSAACTAATASGETDCIVISSVSIFGSIAGTADGSLALLVASAVSASPGRRASTA
ncbi:MAG: hypothetical protein AAFZ01_06350 [Pseudomonadota bacterium]